jgi:hypothetical protein
MAIDSRDIDSEWARWMKLYDRNTIDINDQPKTSYHDFDITDDGVNPENVPYIPEKRGIGAAEVLMFVVVAGLCVPIVHWFCSTIAYWIAG